MALGFGFNKQKVLASAEKNVQSGKLQAAISDYEKIVKEDPKDITVLNTIGDLYARIGNNERAGQYFKKVGDHYAGEGFTVKAIAMYKKLAKLDPGNAESLLKLAELYTQQGLYNDARQQYVQVADACMKSGDLDQAARMFQKMLELDPENTAMQSKLADLYVRLKRNDDARNIFFSAAQSLYARGAMDAADEALGRVLKLDPSNKDALMMRGLIAADSGDGANAIQYLEQIPDLDSRPDALRAMLRAQLLVGKTAETEPLAAKLISIHNDMTGAKLYAEALLAAGDFERALRVYDRYADKFLAANPTELIESLHASISRIKENAPALEILRALCLKAGDTTHATEIMELLAHAWVQAGELQKAKELYKELAQLEPENPLHQQSYKQIIARLGEDAAARPLTAEEGAQAFMVEELESAAPIIEQHYPDDVEDAIKAALTDSELYVSYNLPPKAIAPLEAILPKAPNDVQLNQKLAALYERESRYTEAAKCCDVLASVYRDAGHAEQAQQYADMSARYLEKTAAAPAAVAEPVAAAEESAFVQEIPATPTDIGIQPEAPAAAEFSVEVPPAEAPAEAGPAVAEFAIEVPTPEAPPVEEPPVAPPPAEAAAHEIDLSMEWEGMTSVEEPAAPAPSSQFIGKEAAAAAATDAKLKEALDEARFHLSQSMWDEAQTSIDRCAALSPDAPELAGLREQLAIALASAKAAASAEQPQVAEFIFEEPAVEAPPPSPPAAKPAPPSKPVAAPPPPPPEPPMPAAAPLPPPAPPRPIAMPPPVPAASPAVTAKSGGVLGDLVSDLEASLGDDFAIGGAPAPAKAAAPPAVPSQPAPMAAVASAPAAAAVAPAITTEDKEATSVLADMFAEFKEDVEEKTAEAEDPDTHYNLGVAFKEMGLLDEAIGELQKVCHAIERGHPFGQVIQAYTWLAQCFLDKGVPQAAIKWYEKALKVPNLDEDSRLAVYYELGSAHEAAGDKKRALEDFNEVYASNIDYRDVAERIKALKS